MRGMVCPACMAHPNSHLAYRPDIDGLRAVAVLAVVIFHAFPALLPGGFVGVDIFFVISGYLISSIIFRSLACGEFSFSDFYARRIRRIFPPLLLVTAVSLVIGWGVLLPDEYAQLGKHAAAGLGFVANLVFWMEAGYFDDAAGLKPLLHLWSLGVEEQFYIVWPLAVVLAWRLRQRFWIVLAALAALSFALNIALVSRAPEAGYFLLPPRAWELLAGAALALRLHRSGPLFARDGAGGRRAAACGLALIGLSVVVIDQSRAFPGWWALLPVAGAVLVIAAGEGARTRCRLLAHPLMAGIGLISFPLYLWHWPLLSFVRIVRGGEASPLYLGAAVAAAVLCAWLSYRLLETPVRRQRGWKPVGALVVCGLVLAGCSSNVFMRDGLAFRLKNAQAEKEAAALAWGESQRFSSDCVAVLPPGMPGLCLVVNPAARPGALLLGDSHANHYYWGLGRELAGQGVNLVQLSDGGCGPLYGMSILHEGKLNNCREIMEAAIDYAASSPEISTVFLGGRWMAYVSGRELKDPPGHDSGETLLLPGQPGAERLGRGEVFTRALEETLRRLTSAGKRVVFLHAVPELPFNARECIAWAPNRFVSRTPRPACQTARALTDARALEFRPLLDGILAKYPQVLVFDPVPLMCDDAACYGRRDGVLLYRDDDHLSLDGSFWLGRQMAPALPAMLGRAAVAGEASPESAAMNGAGR